MNQRLVFTRVAGDCIAVQDGRTFGVVPASEFLDHLSITMIDHATSWLSSVIRSTFYLHVHYRIAPKDSSRAGRDMGTRLAILGPYKEREARYQRDLLVKDLSLSVETRGLDCSSSRFGVVASSIAVLFASFALLSSACVLREYGFHAHAQASKMKVSLQSSAEETRENRTFRDEIRKESHINELASSHYRSDGKPAQDIPEHRAPSNEIDTNLSAKTASSAPEKSNLDVEKKAAGIDYPVTQNTPKNGSSESWTNTLGTKAYSTKDMQSFGIVDPINMNNLFAAANSIGIEVKSSRPNAASAKKIYVFSKPGCSDCATVDSVLPEVSRLFLPVIFPAGFI